MLKKITLLRERVENWSVYPFSVPTIASLPEIAITSRVVFFAGENGSGKSTLLEAIAGHYGFGPPKAATATSTTTPRNTIIPPTP
jgi:predicted ATPase